ncbi:MAG: DNA oxidative demethylase AlkB [Betaproteobacteria bacterium]
MNLELFDVGDNSDDSVLTLAPGAVVLHGFARPNDTALFEAVKLVSAEAPFRHLVAPGSNSLKMSVAMTNCGTRGWFSDRHGYRYVTVDPISGKPWPGMPGIFKSLARNAAAAAGFEDFQPEACLINRYQPGARLNLHQDKDENDYTQPIVSVSLGLPATFLFGGLERTDKQTRVPLVHGDVVVWGGPSRLRFHGVKPVKDGNHELLGAQRINITFRRAG